MTEYTLLKDLKNKRVYEYKNYKGEVTQTKANKFLCVGGPLGGHFITYIDRIRLPGAKEYSSYNSAGDKGPSMIYVHKSLLEHQ